MAIVLALTAAASWGWSDFLGGRTSREEHHIPVVLWSQVLGFVPFLAVAFLFAPFEDMTGRDALFGAIAGGGGALGVTMLFRGLSLGRMAVVAPVTALGAAGLPVIWGVVVESETPGALTWSGLVTAMAAIWLVSASHDAERHGTGPRTAGLPEALLASVGFAIVLVALDRTGGASGLWPLLPSRVVLVGLVLSGALVARAPLWPARTRTWRVLALIALLDVIAVSSYLLATRQGLLVVVAVVSSLYPAGTVVLARLRLEERLSRQQLAGLGLAGAAVTLIAFG